MASARAGARPDPVQARSRGQVWRRLARSACLLVAAILPLTAAAEPAERLSSILLVATRSLQDPNFRESVVLVTHHGGGGPVGVILNRPTEVPLSRVFPGNERLKPAAAKLFFGGPVARQTLVFLFKAPTAPKEAIVVGENLYMSLSPELLRRLLDSSMPLGDIRVFAGYSAWAPGQLEREIARGSWYLAEANAGVVFDQSPAELWSELVKRASARKTRDRKHDQPGATTTPLVRASLPGIAPLSAVTATAGERH